MQASPEITLEQPMAPRAARVVAVQPETPGVVTLEIEPPGTDSFPFGPGQFNMLYAFGIGEVPISMSGDPSSPERLVHTVRDVGAVTHALAMMGPGSTLGVRGPFGTAWPVEAAEGHDVAIVAGGIGLAPLRPAIYSVLAKRERFGRVALLYGARTPQDLLFSEQLSEWRSRFDLEVEVTVDAAAPGWQGDVGVVSTLLERMAVDPSDAIALVCGPEIMMRFTIAGLRDRGITDDRIVVSMERNMRCAIGFCGHCQLGPTFVCKDGPVFSFDRIATWFGMREV